jgi:hypothetical protein
MTPTLEEVDTEGTGMMIDDLTTVVGIGTMIGTGRGQYPTTKGRRADKAGHPGETMMITVDVMIETDETIDEMTGEMIDTSERDPSGRLTTTRTS